MVKTEAAAGAAEKSLSEATLLHATNSGALQTRRDHVAKLDEKAALDALRQVEAELHSAPLAGQVVNDAVLAEARRKYDEAASQLKIIDGKIREKRGALQQVGGDVARQRAENAGNELQSAKDRAQVVELEFNAWDCSGRPSARPSRRKARIWVMPWRDRSRSVSRHSRPTVTAGLRWGRTWKHKGSLWRARTVWSGCSR